MKKLKIARISENTSLKEMESIADLLLSTEENHVDIINWENYPYKPQVSFRIAHDSKKIYLRYDVTENHIRAKACENNSQVWLDSCVEFFISPESNMEYYNFEFNCIGTKLLGYRNFSNGSVESADSEIINKIKTFSSLGTQPFEEKTGDFSWFLIAIIPLEVLWKHPKEKLAATNMKGNFYKCGDELTKPHFLSWAEIKTLEPNFHQPEYFGELNF